MQLSRFLNCCAILRCFYLSDSHVKKEDAYKWNTVVRKKIRAKCENYIIIFPEKFSVKKHTNFDLLINKSFQNVMKKLLTLITES